VPVALRSFAYSSTGRVCLPKTYELQHDEILAAKRDACFRHRPVRVLGGWVQLP
jgi:hypothetical protein